MFYEIPCWQIVQIYIDALSIMSCNLVLIGSHKASKCKQHDIMSLADTVLIHHNGFNLMKWHLYTTIHIACILNVIYKSLMSMCACVLVCLCMCTSTYAHVYVFGHSFMCMFACGCGACVSVYVTCVLLCFINISWCHVDSPWCQYQTNNNPWIPRICKRPYK